MLLKSTAAAAAAAAHLVVLLGSVHSFHFHPVSVSSRSTSTSSRVSPPRSISATTNINTINNKRDVSSGNNNVNTGFIATTTTTTTTSSTKLQMVGGLGLADTVIGALRGGAAFKPATSIISALTTALQSGPYGVAALTAIASCVVTPLTLYRQAYSFSVGYGFSVFAMGLALLSVFGVDTLSTASASASSASAPPLFLVAALLFYGFRLGSFLLLRELTVQSKQKQVKSFDKSPLLKRIPLAIGVSMFYAFMVTPVLYLCRSAAATATTMTMTMPATNSITIALAGARIAWIGALMEAITDTQKYIAKRGKDESPDVFIGPTRGLYKLSRHPNYLAEIVFWFGVLVSGASTFGIKSPIAWICSSLGFVGIYKIMIGATDRLDKKQEEKYTGQPLYDDWKKVVPKLKPTTKNIINSFLPVSLLLGGAAAAMKVVQLLAVYCTYA